MFFALKISADIRVGAMIMGIGVLLGVVTMLARLVVSDRQQAFVEESSFQLVETLAEKIAAIIREEFDVAWVKVRVNKPGAIRGSRDVGVIIERGEAPD